MKLITALLLLPFVTGERKSLIQEIVSQLKSSPRHESHSPSYTSDRKFDVIGVGELPLQDGRVGGLDQARDNSALPFLAPLPVQLTEQLSPDHEEHSKDPLESQGSQFISRPSVSHRRKQHSQGLPFRPLGDVINKFIRPNRNGLPPPRAPPAGRPKRRPNSEKNRIHQDKVEDFFPMKEHNRDHRLPERKDHRAKPPRRKPININIKNPFKSILDKSPLKKKHKRPNKDGPFRPPSKVFKGFAPSFEGSVSLEEARRQHEKDKFGSEFPGDKFPTQFGAHRDQNRPHEPKRKRRRKPGRSGSKRPGRPQSRPSSDHDAEMTNHPSHNDHLEEENFNRFAHDGPKPSPVSDEMSVFGHPQTPPRPSQDTLRPFPIELQPGPVRPKRQRPRPGQEQPPGGNLEHFHEAAFNDIPEDDLGFFNEVNFPDISSFGVGWDPKKIRRKREAYEVPLYYKRESTRPRFNRSQRPRRPQRQSSRRTGPVGFWDDPEFDADFFNSGSPAPANFPSFESYSNNYNTQQYYPQTSSRPKPPTRGYTTQKVKQQTRPKIVPKRYVDRYTVDNTYATIEQENSILGSGNFDILKGGTFYDKDDYLRPYSNNKPPRHSYYGDNDIFSNFRDFADIKGDAKEYNNQGYDEGYYYR